MHVQSKKEIDSKRGVFTSRIGQQQTGKPSVLPYLQSSLQGVKDGLNSLKVIVNSMEHQKQNVSGVSVSGGGGSNPLRLSQLGYSYSNSNTNINSTNTFGPPPPFIPQMQQIRRNLTPPKTNFTYQNPKPSLTNIGVGQTTTNTTTFNSHSQPYIPPLPLYSNSVLGTGGQQQQQQQVHYMPINNQLSQNIQVRRTVVPVHYTNQIPARIVVNAAPHNNMNLNMTPPYKLHEQQNNNDEAYQVLLKQYTKLYQKLGKTEQYANELQDQLTKIRQRTNLPQKPPVINPPHPHPSSLNTKRKYSLNVQQLHNKLYRIYQNMVNDIIARRKQSGRMKMGQLFASARKQISTVTSSVEIVTSSYKLM